MSELNERRLNHGETLRSTGPRRESRPVNHKMQTPVVARRWEAL